MTSQHAVSDVAHVVALIEQKRMNLERPVVVGVSGYAGSGKSTLVRSVIESEPTIGDVLLANLIGLFHPEALGRDFSRLWCEVWVPNEIDFECNFSPRKSAEVLYIA